MGSHGSALARQLDGIFHPVLLPGTVATFFGVLAGAKISFRIAPSCTSPRYRGVFTPESFASGCPHRRLGAHLPGPWRTCSSQVLTARTVSGAAALFPLFVHRAADFIQLFVIVGGFACAHCGRLPARRPMLALVSSFFERVSLFSGEPARGVGSAASGSGFSANGVPACAGGVVRGR